MNLKLDEYEARNLWDILEMVLEKGEDDTYSKIAYILQKRLDGRLQ